MIQKILDATNGGLDVILYYYPQAREVIDGHAKLFKARPEERTASASLKKFGNVWKVTDFGDDAEARGAFDVCMQHENITFRQALHLLAERYNIDTQIRAEINRPKVESRPATADEEDGHFSFVARKEPTAAELAVLGETVKAATMEKYSYYALESYSITRKTEKGLQTITFTSNENYPIFMHECGEFRKIYKPLEYEKTYRFFFNGNKPKNYINGMDVVRKAYEKLMSDAEYGEQTNNKLPEVIICSGERDALCLAGLGYLPVWLNSESAKLEPKDYKELEKMAERIYNIPDIDNTGIKRGKILALEYMEIYTVQLPSWLLNYKDHRGRPRKDFRDYIELCPSAQDFRELLQTAPCCKFYETNSNNRTEINTDYLLWYLKCNGFCRIQDRKTKTDRYVRVDNFTVLEYTNKQIRTFILDDLRRRRVGNAVINLFLNSKRTGSTLSDDLDVEELDFGRNSFNSRTLFFRNCVLNVTADKVTMSRTAELGKFVWSDYICQHSYKELPPSFSYNFNADGEIVIDFRNVQSNYFRYLINASRIYWRKEEPIAPEEQFTVLGSKLTLEEREEQTRHLLNKMYAIGYIMHRYKEESNAMCVWVMENKLTDEDESAGGSGKSFMLRSLKKMGIIKIASFNGRDKKLTENKHLLDRVDTVTDVLQIDDASRYFDFQFFYGMVTGELIINKKNQQSEELDFNESPILAFTSNFPPPADDDSTMRRILPVVFSDYYHDDGGSGTGGVRKISDDFGRNLYDENYTEDEYNADINFLIECLQFYLQCRKRKIVLRPPMANVRMRMNINKMGDNFREWAESYFSEDGDHLNKYIVRTDAFEHFKATTGETRWKMQRFTIALKAFVENTPYIYDLNPKELRNASGRIQHRIDGKVEDCIYIRTYMK